jgi:hypothetical protein
MFAYKNHRSAFAEKFPEGFFMVIAITKFGTPKPEMTQLLSDWFKQCVFVALVLPANLVV